jgi:hypothetical protein
MMQTVRSATQTMRARDLDSGAILAACRDWIPVNANLGAAITAHQIAYSYLRARGMAADKELAMLTLRTVILAMTPETADCQQQLDYLASLPMEAWQGLTGSIPSEVRRATLAAVTWNITRRNDN